MVNGSVLGLGMGIRVNRAHPLCFKRLFGFGSELEDDLGVLLCWGWLRGVYCLEWDECNRRLRGDVTIWPNKRQFCHFDYLNVA